MRTVEQFPTKQQMLADHDRLHRTLTELGWQTGNNPDSAPTVYVSDHTLRSTWQHRQHEHEIVIQYVRNLCDTHRWDRQITLNWYHWPHSSEEPNVSSHLLPLEVPVEAAAGTFDGQPITLATIIAMTGVCDIREVA